VYSQIEFFNYGARFYQPHVPASITRKVPPFPGFETSWRDLVKILSGTVRTT
jgi:hypothetical protein